jgi:hypothetical protein
MLHKKKQLYLLTLKFIIMRNETKIKPTLKLVGENGNAFAILGAAKQVASKKKKY